MQKLQCEVCNGSIIATDDPNVYQCEYCGIKYERKQLQRVLIDHRSEIDNFLILARECFECSKGISESYIRENYLRDAREYIKRARELDAQNAQVLALAQEISDYQSPPPAGGPIDLYVDFGGQRTRIPQTDFPQMIGVAQRQELHELIEFFKTFLDTTPYCFSIESLMDFYDPSKLEIPTEPTMRIGVTFQQKKEFKAEYSRRMREYRDYTLKEYYERLHLIQARQRLIQKKKHEIDAIRAKYQEVFTVAACMPDGVSTTVLSLDIEQGKYASSYGPVVKMDKGFFISFSRDSILISKLYIKIGDIVRDGTPLFAFSTYDLQPYVNSD